MANNYVDAITQAQVIATSFSNETLRPLRPNYVFDQVSQAKMWDLNRTPNKGDTLVFPVLGALAINTAPLSATAAESTGSQKSSYTRRSVSLELYGDHTKIDTLQLEPESYANVISDNMFLMTDQAMGSLNAIARTAVDSNKYANEVSGTLSGTYHYYGSSGTAGSMGPLKSADVRKVVADMLGDSVQKFEDGYYVCILNQNQATQLRAETGNASWGAAVLAGDSSVQRRFNGSIGTFEGVNFVVNTETVSTANTAACYFLGADGVGKAIGTNMRIQPNPVMGGDHANMLTLFWDQLVGYRVIRREAVRVVSTTNSVL
jgi:N4-gp56 family major capsid protein